MSGHYPECLAGLDKESVDHIEATIDPKYCDICTRMSAFEKRIRAEEQATVQEAILAGALHGVYASAQLRAGGAS